MPSFLDALGGQSPVMWEYPENAPQQEEMTQPPMTLQGMLGNVLREAYPIAAQEIQHQGTQNDQRALMNMALGSGILAPNYGAPNWSQGFGNYTNAYNALVERQQKQAYQKAVIQQKLYEMMAEAQDRATRRDIEMLRAEIGVAKLGESALDRRSRENIADRKIESWDRRGKWQEDVAKEQAAAATSNAAANAERARKYQPYGGRGSSSPALEDSRWATAHASYVRSSMIRGLHEKDQLNLNEYIRARILGLDPFSIKPNDPRLSQPVPDAGVGPAVFTDDSGTSWDANGNVVGGSVTTQATPVPGQTQFKLPSGITFEVVR